MKRIKKITALLLCLLMVITAMPLTALAEDERPMDPALIADEDKYTDIEYDFEIGHNLESDDWFDEELGVHYQWDFASKTLFVDGIAPDSTLFGFDFNYQKFYVYDEEELEEQQTLYGNYNLGTWVDLTFEGFYLEHVVIGENISIIDSMFLDNYSNLKDIITVENHSGVSIINSPDLISGNYDIEIPINNVVFGERAYAERTYESVILPENVTEIGKRCFYNADIHLIDLSKTCITEIPAECFYGVKNLETVLLPPTVETIGSAAFMYSDIEYITLPSAVVSIGDYVFNQCPRLQSADLSNTNIKELSRTFYGCTSLTDVYLPNGLKKINYAFTNCSSLEYLDIPETVTYLADFSGTNINEFDFPRNLEYVYLGSINAEVLDFGDYINGIEIYGGYGNTSLKSVIFPRENFSEVNSNVFENCTNLESVTLYCCSEIGYRAFAGTNLTEVEIPDNCTLISENAFEDCLNLKTVRLPMDLLYIDGGDPFEGCENLETVIFPSRNKLLYSDHSAIAKQSYNNRAQYFYRHGFLTNENLTVYLYPDTEIEQYCIDYGINYEYIDWDLERNTTVPAPEPEKEFTMEGTIGDGTFVINSSTETSKGAQETLRAIEIYANGPLTTTDMTCSNGTETNLAEIMKAYGVYYVKFMEGTTEIADGLFENFAESSSNLYSLYFTRNVRRIGVNAFRNSGVHDIYFDDYYNDSRSEIGEYAFADNTQLMYVTLNKTITEIKEGTFYNTAIIYCRLKNKDSLSKFNLVLPDNIKKIGKKAFSLSRENIWIAEEPNGTDTEYNRTHYRAGYKTTRGGATISAIDVENGPISVYIPKSVTEIYYDPEHPEDNAIAVTAAGYMDDWIKLRVHYGSAAYQYAKMFGIRYKIVYDEADGVETEEEKNAAPLYDISNPVVPVQYIKGIISKDSWIEDYKYSYMTWKYQPTTKTLVVSSSLYSNFNDYSFYYNDNTPVQQGDLEVDTLVIQGKFSAIYGAERTVQKQYSTPTYYYPTPISFFNPKYIDVSGTTITQLFDEAFKDCTRLESVTIQANPRNIGKNLFENTPALRSVIFEDAVTSIPAGMFKNHKGIQFVEFPETLTSIGANAFNGCTNLQQIVIPDSCVAIGMNAFKSCVNVMSVTLGSGLNQIGREAFADLINCEQVTVKTDKIRTDASVIGIDYRNIFTNLGMMTGGITVNYADGLSTADFKVFDDKRVTKIVLGADIANLKNADCLSSLEEIALSTRNNNYYLVGGALYSSALILELVPRNLESFNIAGGCKGIGENAFNSSAISTITVPASVSTIGAYAFANAKELKSVTLNKGTEEIGEGAFSNCDRLRFIHMPTNLYSVGDNAFKNCDKLASVILNDELQLIGASAFAECPALRGIVIPEHVETIGEEAFANCTGLEYAYIWNAQPLGGDVFLNDSLVRVYTVIGSDTYIWAREYDIPYVSYLDEDAFYTETMLRLDVEAGYIGYCDGEHGDIEWLTVCAADCENEGYIIGVCEYCTELLAEVHIPPLGHNYDCVSHIPATATTGAADIYRCERCGDVYYDYDIAEQGENTADKYAVSGNVVFADNQNATGGEYAARSVAVLLDGVTVARTDTNGNFTVDLPNGEYELTLHYTFGFDRIISVSVSNGAIDCGSIPIIGCDFNRDGALDENDDKLFKILMFARVGHESYVEYADLNHDGVINSTDYAILKNCTGIDAGTYQYPECIIQ